MNSSRKKVFRNSNYTWRITWAIGIALILFSNMIGHHLFYFHYYFFIVGAISLINSLMRYSSIDNNALTIYYGNFFNRKRINLPWSKIKSARLTQIKKSFTRTIGGRVRIPIMQTIEKEALVLRFCDFSLPDKSINDESVLHNVTAEIEINIQEKAIILKTPPHGGFKRLLIEMGKHMAIKIEPSDTTILNFLYYAVTILNALIFLAAVTLGITL
jgi:hypothetical protein